MTAINAFLTSDSGVGLPSVRFPTLWFVNVFFVIAATLTFASPAMAGRCITICGAPICCDVGQEIECSGNGCNWTCSCT